MTELLAPVRDETSFTAALNAGADAVYFGLGQFNMRANSKGIEPARLADFVDQAHRQNVRVYITVNSIIYQDELNILDELLYRIKSARADAVICWDHSVIEGCRKLDIPIHISTQASISNQLAARYYENLGARRFVPARELSLAQIKQLKQNTGMEIETFIHGAMCVSVSGRCFLSQFLYDRSGNRGDCLQPCRHAFRATDLETGDELEVHSDYILSPEDLCALPILDQIMTAGFDAFKIEGRSRAPEYIRTVTSVYRRAIDAVNANTFNQELVTNLTAELKKVYNRDFSTGFYLGKPGPRDWTDRYGNRATQRKIFVGKVINYYKNARIAYIDVTAHPLAVGETVQIHGPTTGIEEFTITEMKSDDAGVLSSIQKGKVTFPCPPLVRRSDDVYKIEIITENHTHP